MKRFLTATIVAALLSGTAFAMPGPCMGGHGMGSHPGIFRALMRLDLTDSQKHEIALALKKHREEVMEQADAMHNAREGLRQASEAEELDEARVRKAYEAVATAGEEMAVRRARIHAELRGILTPEQWQVLQKNRDEKRERMKSRREHKPRSLDEWIEEYGGEDKSG